MSRKPLKVPINRNVVKTYELPKSLEKYSRKIRNAEEIDVAEMFMVLGKSQKALEDSIKNKVKEAIVELKKEGVI